MPTHLSAVQQGKAEKCRKQRCQVPKAEEAFGRAVVAGSLEVLKSVGHLVEFVGSKRELVW